MCQACGGTCGPARRRQGRTTVDVKVDGRTAVTIDAEKWITVHPNGKKGPGSPVLLGENGEVKGGMGGKFNGHHISQVKGKTPLSQSAPQSSEQSKPKANLREGHVELKEHRPVLKSTAAGIAIEMRAKGLKQEGYRWLPKSHASVENGHVVGVAPWLAEKHGFGLTQPLQKKPEVSKNYLNVPFENKELAKSAGAKWDPDKRKWYVHGDVPESLKHFTGASSKPAAQIATRPAQTPTKPYAEMSVFELENEHAKLKKQRRDYDNLMNEGGEGYNPYDESMRQVERHLSNKRGDPVPQQKHHWAYSNEAVQRALRGEDSAWPELPAEDGRDDPESYAPRRLVRDNSIIGSRLETTREGFLICRDVPLARTGDQVYLAHEVPGLPAKNGQVVAQRDPDEVFDPVAIESFRGKPLTDDHPFEDVTPQNYRQHIIGVVQSPRRGTGPHMNCIVGDLMVYDPDAIDNIRSGRKRELSCGYDADYEVIQPRPRPSGPHPRKPR